MNTVYLSGPITNDPEHYKEHFSKCANFLKSIGYDVINPADPEVDKIDLPENVSLDDEAWIHYIMRDIQIVKDCDVICMLNGWRDSPGANIEYWVAKKYKLKLMFEGHWTEC